jgi:enoyl-CoA hydratase/carnithine racemase
MTDTVLYEVTERVATITLNRPDRLNAVAGDMRFRLGDLIEQADSDPDVGAIVVTGAGRGFCAGADRDTLKVIDDEAIREHDGRKGRSGLGVLLDVRTPVIAAVNGACAGLGFCVALLADIRFVAAEAKVTTSFARLGLPAESGSAWLLSRVVGPARALDLLYSARVLTGTEAHAVGLAQYVHPTATVLAEAQAYARTVAGLSGWSHATMREQVYADGHSTLGDAFDRSVELTAEAVMRPEFQALLSGDQRGR